jgi:hypothetical protein
MPDLSRIGLDTDIPDPLSRRLIALLEQAKTSNPAPSDPGLYVLVTSESPPA